MSQSPRGHVRFHELPEDIHLYICESFLDPRHINNLVLTCKVLHTRLNRTLWRPLIYSIGGDDEPLGTIVIEGSLASVQKLVAHYDLNAASSEIHEAIRSAAIAEHYDVVRYLLTLGPMAGYRQEPKREGGIPRESLLQTLAGSGQAELVRLLLPGATVEDKVRALEQAVNQATAQPAEQVIKAILDQQDPDFPKILALASGRSLLQTTIWRSYRQDCKSLLTLLLDYGLEIDSQTAMYNETPLMLAVKNRWPWAVDTLLSRGASVTHADGLANTALHTAAMGIASPQNLEIVRLLLQYGSDLTCRNQSGCGPVDLAVINQRVDIIHFMVASGFSLKKIENKDHLLSVAVKMGDQDLALEMLRLGAEVNRPQTVKDHTWPPLHHAAFNNQIGMMELLVSNGAILDPFAKSNLPTPLHLALGQGHLVAAQWLLDKGADITRLSKRLHPWVRLDSTLKTRWTSLHFAAIGGVKTFDLVSRRDYRVPWDDNRLVSLWEAAVSISDVVDTQYLQRIYDKCWLRGVYRDPIQPSAWLFRTMRNATETVVQFVLERSDTDLSDKDYEGKTLIHHAAEHGNLQALRLLLQADPLVDQRDNDGKTALFYAAQERLPHAVRILLEHDAAITSNEDIDHDPVRACLFNIPAERHNHDWIIPMQETVQQLIKHGADFNAMTNQRTYFHDALMSEDGFWISKYSVQALLDLGADPDIADGDGKTVLHLAAELGYDEAVAVLLNNGADMSAKTPCGKTAVQFADHGTVDLFMRNAAGLEIDLKDFD
ncbi:ankyrin repeat-containing domain protein [Aspergillus karnatakaensis]|uniref:ankyrin repeat-containing domain protein n=1 Tax=Aspergillus karnatakaensis TaxID=1810916 RepID=UPI003CCE42C5